MTTLSPLLADIEVAGDRRPYARRWLGCLAAIVATTALGWAVDTRWFDPLGPAGFVYRLHDDVALPAYGHLWTALYPYGAVWLVPAILLIVVAAVDYLAGWSLPRLLHRTLIVMLSHRGWGHALLRRVHQRAGRRGSFIRLVVANEAAGAVEAALAQPGRGLRAWSLIGLQAGLPGEDVAALARPLGQAALLVHALGIPSATTSAPLRAAVDALTVPQDAPVASILHLLTTENCEENAIRTVALFLRDTSGTLERRIAATDRSAATDEIIELRFLIIAAAAAALDGRYRSSSLAAFDAVERLGMAALLAGRQADADAVAGALLDTEGSRLAAFAAARATDAVATLSSSWHGHVAVADLPWLAGAVTETASRPDDFSAGIMR